MYITEAVQWNMYALCGKHICSGVYASIVTCLHTSAPSHIFNSSEFIFGAYVVMQYVL